MTKQGKGKQRGYAIGALVALVLVALFLLRCSEDASPVPAPNNATQEDPYSYEEPSGKTNNPAATEQPPTIEDDPKKEPNPGTTENPSSVEPEPVNIGRALPTPKNSWFTIPHGKGEHWSAYHTSWGSAVFATLTHSATFDPLWNRRSPETWGANEFAQCLVGDNPHSWRRLTLERYPAMHGEEDASWDVAHSPFVFDAGGNEPLVCWMRFKHKPYANPAYYTTVESVSPFRQLFKLQNLSDSPRQRKASSGILFRTFLYADERSELQYWELGNTEPTFVFGDGSKDYMSRPVWIDQNHFVVIKGSVVSKDGYYDGEVVLVEVSDDAIESSRTLDKGRYPLDTVGESLLYDAAHLRLIVRKEDKVLVFDNAPTFNFEATQTDVSAPGAIAMGDSGPLVLSNNEVMLINDEGDVVSSNVYLPFVPKTMHGVGDGILLLLGRDRDEKGFAFTYGSFNPDKGFIIRGDDTTTQQELPPAAWLLENSEYIKRIDKAASNDRLTNTCLIYDFEFKLQNERIKNKRGTMVELYQQSPKELIRTEDNFGGDWVIKAWDGEEAYIATDATKQFVPSRGDTKNTLLHQMEVRSLLLLTDLETREKHCVLCMGQDSVTDPETRTTYDTWRYERDYGDGRSAVYWFDRSDGERNLVCAQLLFDYGDDKPQLVQLWLSDYRDIPDADKRDPGEPLRVPGEVRGYKFADEGLEHIFSADFVPQIKRPTFYGEKIVLKSCYNLPELGLEDLGKSYRID